MDTSPPAAGFRLRNGNFNLLVLRLLDPRPEVVLPALRDQFQRAPGFLRFAPIVIGLDELEVPPERIDFHALIGGLHASQIVPVGTVGGLPDIKQAALAAGLPPLRPAAGGGEGAPEPAAPAPAVAPPPAPARTAMVVSQSIRSGQRIHAEGRDLIVTGTVNPGAEVIADGHVHIYGALRGRALAGGADDRDARIFALVFDPELVAIAGYYAPRDALGGAPIGRGCAVRLDHEALRFDALG